MVVQPGGDLPAARGQSSMVVMGEKLYVFGGVTSYMTGKSLNTTHEFLDAPRVVAGGEREGRLDRRAQLAHGDALRRHVRRRPRRQAADVRLRWVAAGRAASARASA